MRSREKVERKWIPFASIANTSIAQNTGAGTGMLYTPSYVNMPFGYLNGQRVGMRCRMDRPHVTFHFAVTPGTAIKYMVWQTKRVLSLTNITDMETADVSGRLQASADPSTLTGQYGYMQTTVPDYTDMKWLKGNHWGLYARVLRAGRIQTNPHVGYSTATAAQQVMEQLRFTKKFKFYKMRGFRPGLDYSDTDNLTFLYPIGSIIITLWADTQGIVSGAAKTAVFQIQPGYFNYTDQ